MVYTRSGGHGSVPSGPSGAVGRACAGALLSRPIGFKSTGSASASTHPTLSIDVISDLEGGHEGHHPMEAVTRCMTWAVRGAGRGTHGLHPFGWPGICPFRSLSGVGGGMRWGFAVMADGGG